MSDSHIPSKELFPDWPSYYPDIPDGALLEAANSPDFSDAVLGTLVSSFVDYTRDEDSIEGYTRLYNWRHFPVFYVRTIGNAIVRVLYIREVKMEVSKAELYGLLTRLENILQNNTDPALMLRTLSSLVEDSEAMLPRVLKLREILNNTDV